MSNTQDSDAPLKTQVGRFVSASTRLKFYYILFAYAEAESERQTEMISNIKKFMPQADQKTSEWYFLREFVNMIEPNKKTLGEVLSVVFQSLLVEEKILISGLTKDIFDSRNLIEGLIRVLEMFIQESKKR